MTSVSVVIPNYNGMDHLRVCLDSLARQTLRPDQIIVVDDASVDGSAEMVRADYTEAILLQMPCNGGFCKAANAGLKRASGDVFALLNNDTEAEPGWLAGLVEALETQPKVGFCASKMLFFDHRDLVNSAGLFMRTDGVGRDVGFGRPDGPAFNAMREVFGASAGAAAYKREMLDDVGLLDEDLIAYAEDLDLSFRAQLRGWRCLYVPSSVVYHRMGATYKLESHTKVYLSSRNMLNVVLKNMPTTLLRRYWHHVLAAQIYQMLHFARRGRAWPAIKGKVDAVSQLRQILAKRRDIQRTRRTPDSQIEAILSPSGWHRRPDR